MAALLPILQAGTPYYVPAFAIAATLIGAPLLGWFVAGPVAAAVRG